MNSLERLSHDGGRHSEGLVPVILPTYESPMFSGIITTKEASSLWDCLRITWVVSAKQC